MAIATVDVGALNRTWAGTDKKVDAVHYLATVLAGCDPRQRQEVIAKLNKAGVDQTLLQYAVSTAPHIRPTL